MSLLSKLRLSKPQVKIELEEELEKATFYLRSGQQDVLDVLRLKLKRYKVKTNKSEMVRVAIDIFINQGEEQIAKILKDKTSL